MKQNRHSNIGFCSSFVAWCLCIELSQQTVLGASGIVIDTSWGRTAATLQPVKQVYQIPDTMGKTVGNNLFHSFSSFDLTAGQQARFSGPIGIANVLTRVTGGTESSIDGILSCAIPGANFYFINPAGVVFGSHASVNVSGSFVVTTADYVKLGAGGRFDASHPANDLLTTEPPSAFGFLAPQAGNSIAGVTFHGSQLLLNQLTDNSGKTLTVAAGSITADQAAKVDAAGGQLQLTAVNSSGELTLKDLNTDSFHDFGDISISGNSHFLSSGDIFGTTGGGGFLIRGRNLTLDGTGSVNGRSIIENASYGGHGKDGEIELSGTLTLDGGSWIYSDSMGESAGDSTGNLNISAKSIQLHNGSVICTTVIMGPGSAGSITLHGIDTLLAAEGSRIFSSADSGRSGDITIKDTKTVTVSNGAKISTTVFESGTVATIEIDAQSVTVDGGIIGADPDNSGAAIGGGNITITGKDVFVRNKGRISSSTDTDGPGGALNISAASCMTIDNSMIDTSAYANGAAGAITITANQLQLHNFGTIDSHSFGVGNGGVVTFNSGNISLDTKSGVFTSSEGTGTAGSIKIGGKTPIASLSLLGESQITSTAGKGTSGNINIHSASGITLQGDSLISVNSTGGDAGTITLTAPDTVLLWNSQVSAQAYLNGGNLVVDPHILGLENSTLRANAIHGNGGKITLTTDFLYSLGIPIAKAITADSQNQSAQPGTVSIRSGTDFAGSLVGLPDGMVSEREKLREGCARKNPKANSFVLRGAGGLPLMPDSLCPNFTLGSAVGDDRVP